MTQPRARILCIEDEATLQADLQEELQAAGYEVRAANSVASALECLQSYTPDLVLCDVMLGADDEPDGYALHRFIRQQRADLAAIPFIILTALGQRDQLLEAKRQGIDDYLVKPVDYDLLLATLSARLAQVGRVLNSQVSGKAELFERMRDVLAQLPGAVLLCDDQRMLHFANHKAQILMQETGIWRVNPVGKIVWPEATHASLQLLQQRLELMRDLKVGARTVQHLEMQSAADNVLLSLLKIEGDAGTDSRQLYAMFVCSTQSRPVPDVETLRLLYGLTRSEAKVARLLALGRRSEEIATELEVSAATVAFHLRNLFQKTGVARQSDLVAQVLAAGWTLPALAEKVL